MRESESESEREREREREITVHLLMCVRAALAHEEQLRPFIL